ncbi:uncharacterized protein J3D65DRAFT_389652 [Phyllosticta citribraziliensis]|uniref:Uncharacterized protein n=1 Tax=Phyllosticta citribraziliensis TaxID=989973 RepID=A0ABR1LKS9_9PEZI
MEPQPGDSLARLDWAWRQIMTLPLAEKEKNLLRRRLEGSVLAADEHVALPTARQLESLNSELRWQLRVPLSSEQRLQVVRSCAEFCAEQIETAWDTVDVSQKFGQLQVVESRAQAKEQFDDNSMRHLLERMCPCNLSGNPCRIKRCPKEHRCPSPKCAGECGLPHGQLQVQDQTCSLFLRDRARHALQFPDTAAPCPRGHDLPELRAALLAQHDELCRDHDKKGKKQRYKAKQQDEAIEKAAACPDGGDPGNKTEEDCRVARPEKKAKGCFACHRRGHVASVCWHLHPHLAPAGFTADLKVIERFLTTHP